MTTPVLLLGMRLVAVVDRIEDDWAVVEWRSTGELADVPVDLLPCHAREGDRLVVRISPRTNGSAEGRAAPWPLLVTDHGAMRLPSHAPIHPGQRYRLRLNQRNRAPRPQQPPRS